MTPPVKPQYSPDNPFAPKPPVAKGYSEDNPFAPRSELTTEQMQQDLLSMGAQLPPEQTQPGSQSFPMEAVVGTYQGIGEVGTGIKDFVSKFASPPSLEELRAAQANWDVPVTGGRFRPNPRNTYPTREVLDRLTHAAILARAQGKELTKNDLALVTIPPYAIATVGYGIASRLMDAGASAIRGEGVRAVTRALTSAGLQAGLIAEGGAQATRVGYDIVRGMAKPKTEFDPLSPETPAQTAAHFEKINSFQALQQRILQGDHPELVALKDRLMNSNDALVTSTLVSAHRDLTPEGTTIVPAIERPGVAISNARQSGVKSNIATYQRPDGLFDVALYGSESPLTLDKNLNSFRQFGYFEGQEASVNGGRVTFQGPAEGGAIKVRVVNNGIDYYTSLDQLRRTRNTTSAIIPTEMEGGVYQRFRTTTRNVTPAALLEDFSQFHDNILAGRPVWQDKTGDVGLPYIESIAKGPYANAVAAAKRYFTHDEIMAEFNRVATEDVGQIDPTATRLMDMHARIVENVSMNASFERQVKRFAELRGIPREYADGLENYFGQQLAKKYRETYMEPSEVAEFNKVQQELSQELGRPAGAQETLGAMKELPLSQLAATNGYRIEYTPNNAISVLSHEGEELGRFNVHQDVKDFINKSGQSNGNELVNNGGLPPASGGTRPPSGAKPLGPDDGLQSFFNAWSGYGFSARLLDVERSALDFMTGRESSFESVDNLHRTKIAESVRKVMTAWGVAKDGAQTFAKEFLDPIRPMMNGLNEEQFANIFRYIEAQSSDELTAELLARGKDEAVKVAGDIAALRANTSKAIEFSRKYQAIKDDLKGQGADVIDAEIAKLVQAMKITPEDFTAAGMFDGIRQRDINVMSVADVGRLADALMWDAPSRDQFAKMADMSPKQILVAKQFDRLFEAGAKVAGIPDYRIIRGYIAHYRSQIARDVPTFEQAFLNQRGLGASLEGKFLSEFVRTGEIDALDLNPFTVAVRYIDTAFKGKDFVPVYQQSLKDFNTEINKLPLNMRGSMTERVKRFLSDVRGLPAPTNATIRSGIEALNKYGKIQLPPNIIDKLVYNTLRWTSSAMMAFRPYLGLRHLSQYFQNVGPRFGVDVVREGLVAAEQPGAIAELRSRGLMSDLNITALVTPEEEGASLITKAGGSAWEAYQQLQKAGHAATLLPLIYEHTFAATFYGVRAKALRVLNDIASGKISKIKGYDQISLDSFAPSFRAEFDNLAKQSVPQAADLIGRRAAVETIFEYQRANAPRGWNSVQGRMLTQYGIWSLHETEMVSNMLTRGSLRHKINYATKFAMAQAATWLAGRSVGVDLLGATMAHSLFWAGSPQVSLLQTAYTAMGGYGVEQKLAQDRLYKLIPSLADPRSMFIPFSYFVGDWMQAINEYNDPNRVYSATQIGGRAVGAPTIKHKSWVDDYMESLGLHFYPYQESTALSP